MKKEESISIYKKGFLKVMLVTDQHNLDEVLTAFEYVLRGQGYGFDGYLDFVDKEKEVDEGADEFTNNNSKILGVIDNSLEYTKMCRKAVEIQESWVPKIGDFFFDDDYDSCGVCIVNKCGDSSERKIWLPRQDQSQELIMSFETYLSGLIYDLYEFSKEYLYFSNGNDLRFNSMEQLWLGYVMLKKYNKVWIGDEWKEIFNG